MAWLDKIYIEREMWPIQINVSRLCTPTLEIYLYWFPVLGSRVTMHFSCVCLSFHLSLCPYIPLSLCPVVRFAAVYLSMSICIPVSLSVNPLRGRYIYRWGGGGLYTKIYTLCVKQSDNNYENVLGRVRFANVLKLLKAKVENHTKIANSENNQKSKMPGLISPLLGWRKGKMSKTRSLLKFNIK